MNLTAYMQLLGIVCFVAGCFVLAIWLGLVVLGLSLFALATFGQVQTEKAGDA